MSGYVGYSGLGDFRYDTSVFSWSERGDPLSDLFYERLREGSSKVRRVHFF